MLCTLVLLKVFNYSQVLIDNDEHFLKIGVAPKALLGHAAAYVHTDDFSYNLVNEDTSQYLTGTFDYGYSNNINGIINNGMAGSNPTFSDLIDPSSKLGFGLDIGAVYEWRPNYAKFKYDMDGETNLWRRDENKYKLEYSNNLDLNLSIQKSIIGLFKKLFLKAILEEGSKRPKSSFRCSKYSS